MRRWLSFFALLAAFALGTRLGWWAVPVIAALWGALRPTVPAPAATAALAAAAAWGVWLLIDWRAGQGALGALTTRLGGVMNLSPFLPILLTLVLPALLAWSAAALSGAIAQRLAQRSGGFR